MTTKKTTPITTKATIDTKKSIIRIESPHQRLHQEFKESIPIVLCVKNASNYAKKVKLFAANNARDLDAANHEFTHVFLTGEDSSEGYKKLMASIAKQEIKIGLIYINHSNVSKLLSKDAYIYVRYRKNNRIAKKIFMTLDPYQQQTTILAVRKEFTISNKFYLELLVDSNDIINLSFYPSQILQQSK